MNFQHQMTASVSSTPEEIRKRRTPTTMTATLDEDSSSCEETIRLDQSTSTTAGLFIHNPSEKPLPLTFQRTIPLPRFWKRVNRLSCPTGDPPDILRRTGEATAQFAKDVHCQESSACRRHPQNDWLCRHCNHDNALSAPCALCGEVNDEAETGEGNRSFEHVPRYAKPVRRSYSAHVSSTPYGRGHSSLTFFRSRSMSDSDEL